MNMKVKREVKLVLPHDFDHKISIRLNEIVGSFTPEDRKKKEEEFIAEIHLSCHQAFKLGLETNV